MERGDGTAHDDWHDRGIVRACTNILAATNRFLYPQKFKFGSTVSCAVKLCSENVLMSTFVSIGKTPLLPNNLLHA